MTFLTDAIGDASGSRLLLVLAAAIGAFFFEDITTIVVGVLAADGIIGVPLAFLSLYLGIALGDTALYTLGAYARTHPRFSRYIDHDFTSRFRGWLTQNYAFKAFSGHFIPGFRFTTFVASGFFRLPLKTYIPAVIAGGLVLETTLFTLAYWFGNATTTWLKPVRWSVAVVFIAVILVIARRNYLAYRAHQGVSSIPPTENQVSGA